MALEPHYEIREILVRGTEDPPGPELPIDSLKVQVEVTFFDETTSEQASFVLSQKHFLDNAAIDGQITAIKAIVLAAAKQHFDTQEVKYPDPPELP